VTTSGFSAFARAGRAFSADDRADTPLVGVINQSMARSISRMELSARAFAGLVMKE
jgi:hypothetical protein